MKRDIYLKKLTRAVRWRLPEEDANEILMDYDELLSQYSDGQIDTFVKKHGRPTQAAKVLIQQKDYHCWLVVFCFLVICLLVPEILPFLAYVGRFSTHFLYLVFLLGFVISLIWFHPRGRTKFCESIPKRLLVLLLILLIVTGSMGVFLFSLFLQKWSVLPHQQYGLLAHRSLLLTGMVSVVFGVYGLVQARLADRRWRALYVLGLAVLTTCALLSSMLSIETFVPFYTLLIHPAILLIAGIFGSVVSLC